MTMTQQSVTETEMLNTVYENQESQFIEQDILGYLEQHEEKELLRFITCGSVDDGKSTLIGRLLHDSKMIFEDQLAAITKDSKKSGTQGDKVDLALLVDGLQAEREQGITIDVAYRYFSTDKRKFIIADTPGHEQYTRNMATGASTCNLAIILIDARKGVQTQTKRHSFICSLLGVKQVVVAINKMDLVDYAEETFEAIKAEYLAMATSLNIPHIHCIPLSALLGDNVVNVSDNLSWFQGKTLMSYLETVQIHEDSNNTSFRFPIQLVCRPNSNFRGFQGTVASGALAVGDAVTVLPANTSSTIKTIENFSGKLGSVQAKEAVTLTFHDEVDVSRGDMIVKSTEDKPFVSAHLTAQIIWMHDDELEISKGHSKEYCFKFASKTAVGTLVALQHRVDINTFETHNADVLKLNEIGSANIALTEQVVFDTYQDNKQTGAFIIIDRLSNQTVGAGMIEDVLVETNNTSMEVGELSEFEKELILLVRKHFG